MGTQISQCSLKFSCMFITRHQRTSNFYSCLYRPMTISVYKSSFVSLKRPLWSRSQDVEIADKMMKILTMELSLKAEIQLFGIPLLEWGSRMMLEMYQVKACSDSEPTKQPMEPEDSCAPWHSVPVSQLFQEHWGRVAWCRENCAPGGQMVSSPTEACGWTAAT